MYAPPRGGGEGGGGGEGTTPTCDHGLTRKKNWSVKKKPRMKKKMKETYTDCCVLFTLH